MKGKTRVRHVSFLLQLVSNFWIAVPCADRQEGTKNQAPRVILQHHAQGTLEVAFFYMPMMAADA